MRLGAAVTPAPVLTDHPEPPCEWGPVAVVQAVLKSHETRLLAAETAMETLSSKRDALKSVESRVRCRLWVPSCARRVRCTDVAGAWTVTATEPRPSLARGRAGPDPGDDLVHVLQHRLLDRRPLRFQPAEDPARQPSQAPHGRAAGPSRAIRPPRRARCASDPSTNLATIPGQM